MLDAEFVRRILDYDPETGVFRWRAGYCRSVRPGRVAGRVNGRGYASISIGNKHHSSHRLAWLYVTGEWPPKTIFVDHINGVKTDNRFSNLRLATPSQNAQNRSKQIERLKGATLHRTGKWQAYINAKYLGLFDTEQEAHAAYVKAANELFGEFARAG